MRTKASRILALMLFLTPGIARSIPYLYGVDPLVPSASSTIGVLVRASDGFTQAQDGISNVKWTDIAGSSFTSIAEESGVLNPVLAISDLQLRTGEIAIAGALGSSSLTFVLTLDEIFVTAIGDPLGAPQGTGSNGSVTLSGAKQIAFSGRLVSQGETLSFSFDIPLGTPSSGDGLLNINASWNGSDPFSIQQVDVNSGNRFNPGLQEIGSIGGVVWSVNAQAILLGETFVPIAPVPEPSTVLLMGFGLMAMGLQRRRQPGLDRRLEHLRPNTD